MPASARARIVDGRIHVVVAGQTITDRICVSADGQRVCQIRSERNDQWIPTLLLDRVRLEGRDS